MVSWFVVWLAHHLTPTAKAVLQPGLLCNSLQLSSPLPLHTIFSFPTHSSAPAHQQSTQSFLLPRLPPTSILSKIPAPTHPIYKLFPINFLLAKLNHHLLGLSDPSSYILARRRMASSCRTWERYWRRVSASWREVGGLNI